MINKEIGAFTAQAYQDNKFKTVTKEDVLGKWSVFFFYPADFTFVCPTELEDLQNIYDKFQSVASPRARSFPPKSAPATLAAMRMSCSGSCRLCSSWRSMAMRSAPPSGSPVRRP